MDGFKLLEIYQFPIYTSNNSNREDFYICTSNDYKITTIKLNYLVILGVSTILKIYQTIPQGKKIPRGLTNLMNLIYRRSRDGSNMYLESVIQDFSVSCIQVVVIVQPLYEVQTQ